MQENYRYFLAALVLVLVFTSMGCKKGNEFSQSLNAGKCEIKASITGAVSATYSSDALGSNVINNSVLINLASSNIKLPVSQFVLIIPVSAKLGTYNFKTMNGAAGWAASYVHQNGSGGWATGAGADNDFTLTITKATASELEGDFYGTMRNDEKNSTIQISNGSFKAKF